MKNLKTTLTIVFISMTLFLNAQGVQWAKISTNYCQYTDVIERFPNGDLLIGSSSVVKKYSSSGGLLFEKQIGYYASIKVDEIGNFYVHDLNSTATSIDIDPSSNDFIVLSQQYYIGKYDGNGDLIWAITLDNLYNSENGYGFELQIDNQNNPVFSGALVSTTDFDPSAGVLNLSQTPTNDKFIAKYSSNGDLLFAERIQYVMNKIKFLIQDDNSFIFSLPNKVQFYNTNGIFTSELLFTGQGINQGGILDFKLDNLGNFYVIDKKAQDFGTSEYARIYIRKYDNSMNFIMYKEIYINQSDYTAGPSSLNLQFGNNNELYLYGDLNFEQPFNTYWTHPMGLFKYNDNLELIDFKGFEPTTNFFPAIDYLVDDGNIYIGGMIVPNYNADFDFSDSELILSTTTYNCGSSTSYPYGRNSGYLAKYCLFPDKPTITTNDTICSSMQTTFSVANQVGVSQYQWELPSGWSGSSTTNTINVTSNANSGYIKVNSFNSCGNSKNDSIFVTVLPTGIPPTPQNLTGNLTVCPNSTNLYSSSISSGASSYIWTLPNGWTGVSSTNSISALASSNAFSGNVSISANNACGSSSLATISVSVNVDLNTTINSTTLSVNDPNGTYQWINCTTNQVVSGATSQSFSPTQNGSYKCQVSANGCTGTTECLTFTNTSGISENKNSKFKIYPNPSSTTLTIEVADAHQIKNVKLLTLNGQVLLEKTFSTENTNLDISKFSKGIYFIEIDGLREKIILE